MNEQVVLLQTDIVDSTKLAEALGEDGAARVWSSFDRVARDLAIEWGGEELARGDGFLLRFDSIDHAVGYARATHAGLRALEPPLQVRIGVHAGPVAFRTNIDSHVKAGARAVEASGLSIAVTVRVMSLARGGQTLVSEAARLTMKPSSFRVVTHGHWRLKGVEDPVEVFEVGDPGATFTAPQDMEKAYRVARLGDRWVPQRDIAHSLPAERNAFVGRSAHLRELEERIDAGARLLTIVGTGGTGKTRFVQHFAWEHLGAFSGGAWFCDLSAATSHDGVCVAVAQGLGVQLGPTDLVDQIGLAMKGRGRALFVLDNFEQVAHLATTTLARWVDASAQATFIVTSRNVLGLDGEELVPLPPLSPNEGERLFDIRSRASRAQAGVETGHAVSDLVALLDGLPLAIELAAARIRVLPVDEIVRRLRHRFSFLRAQHGRSGRQATLQAAFDWSWDLLSEAERTALAQLSIFEGGFDVEACEAIVEPASADEPLDLLQSLVDKSLVVRLDDGRFTLLKTIQEYAAERLDADARGSAIARHWRYYGGLDEQRAAARACADLDNLVTATRRATAAGDGEGAADALVAAWWALRRQGPFAAAIPLAEGVHRLEAVGERHLARVDYVIGSAWRHGGSFARASGAFDSGLASARSAQARREESWILGAMGELLTHTRQPEPAETALREALRLAELSDDFTTQGTTLNALGALAQNQNRPNDALPFYERALAIAQCADDRHMEGGILGNLGGALHALGRLEEAETHYRSALALAEWSGNERWKGNTRSNLGLLHHEKGESDPALTELMNALLIARRIGHRRLECTATWNLGLVHDARGMHDQAIGAYTDALRIAEDMGDAGSVAQLSAALATSSARLAG